ncbi:MAG: hypothetical protein JXQ30_07730 [Spirochaetes bacterium]|nr:hypothetical protein [Spirochaetota bacterium]
MKGIVIVIGLGEIGKPIYDVIRKKYDAIGIDIEEKEVKEPCEIMHICYPYEIDDFIQTTINYIETYKPALTVINSTILPGTTRRIYNSTEKLIVHSPVRGKHRKMGQELMHYTKFIGGINKEASTLAAQHFQTLGMKIKILDSPETTELAKLSSTTYFGLIIAWAQEVERYCRKLSIDYDQVVSFYEEIGYLPPVKYFPGEIGGHCIMPNIKILQRMFESDILNAIKNSNEMKKKLESS